MAVTVEYRWSTGTIHETAQDDAATLEFLVQGTDDLITAKNALGTNVPATFDGLPLSDVNITDRLAEEIWAGEARYGTRDKQSGDSTFTFEIGTQSVKTTQAKETINAYAPTGETAPDFKGGIGFNGERFDGADIVIPTYQFGETHYQSTVDKATIFALVAKANNATFKGFAAGEVLFLGASGSARSGDGIWEVRYAFLASPNITGLTVGDITGIAKKGWEYLWVLYEETEDTTAKFITPRPRAAYVERVYDVGNLAALGIGS